MLFWTWLILPMFLLLTWRASQVFSCYGVIVGQDASADGSVLVGHNEQNGGLRILNFRRVPRQHFATGAVVRLRRGGKLAQLSKTWAFLWSENPGLEFSDGYLNECGVAIVSNRCPAREDDYETLVRRGEIRDGGIGYMLRRLVVQRARTAREGVELAGKLVQRFGYVDSGRTYVIADPRAAWLLSVVRGRRWVAQRVPDNAVVVLPNIHIIGQVDLDDTDNFLASPDLVDYAAQRGWFDPNAGKPFNFREVYRHNGSDPPDQRRQQGRQLVMGNRVLWPSEPPPLGVKPKQKLTVAAVAVILRNTEGVALTNTRTQEMAVFQLRTDMAREIGCVYWRSTAEPSTSVLTPWYLGITETPKSYYQGADVQTQLPLDHHFHPPQDTFSPDRDLAWWTFKRLQDLVHEDYESRIKIVRPVWAAFEDRGFRNQQAVEKEAIWLWEADKDAAHAYLTRYCDELAAEACRKADELTRILKSGKPRSR